MYITVNLPRDEFVVWSVGGPVPLDGVRPWCLTQSILSPIFVFCQPHVSDSKSHVLWQCISSEPSAQSFLKSQNNFALMHRPSDLHLQEFKKFSATNIQLMPVSCNTKGGSNFSLYNINGLFKINSHVYHSYFVSFDLYSYVQTYLHKPIITNSSYNLLLKILSVIIPFPTSIIASLVYHSYFVSFDLYSYVHTFYTNLNIDNSSYNLLLKILSIFTPVPKINNCYCINNLT